MKPSAALWPLGLNFASLSLVAVGGINAIVPEMHRQIVDVGHLMSDREFADLFAMAQAAPGPNVIFATLVGYQLAGLAGAAVATLAICGPTCLLAYVAAHLCDRFKGLRWPAALQTGLVPVSVGLIGATGLILAQAADRTFVDGGLTLGVAALALTTRVNPLWMLAAAALAGAVGMT